MNMESRGSGEVFLRVLFQRVCGLLSSGAVGFLRGLAVCGPTRATTMSTPSSSSTVVVVDATGPVPAPYLHRTCTVLAPYLHGTRTIPVPYLHRIWTEEEGEEEHRICTVPAPYLYRTCPVPAPYRHRTSFTCKRCGAKPVVHMKFAFIRLPS